MFTIKGKYTSALMTIDNYDESCINQVNVMCSHPAFTNPIVIQPDGHAGKGSCVGFTMSLSDKIVPNVVGTDLGCGMLSIKIDNFDDTLKNIDHQIKRSIPTGTHIHNECQMSPTNWNDLFNSSTLVAQQFVLSYNNKFGTNHIAPVYDIKSFEDVIIKIGVDPKRAKNAIGTLGSGNHYCELGESSKGGYWLTIHSGSRKFGEKICMYHQNIAKKNLEVKRSKDLQIGISVITSQHRYDQSLIQSKIDQLKKDLGLDFGIDIKGMEYLEGESAMNYFFDMILAQQYARFNRKLMGEIILKNAFKTSKKLDEIECIHNYIDFEDLIIRKGAIRSYTGERSVIPFNMEDGLLITEGKSNLEWNYSAPHGAGRLMSRTKAKEVLSLEEMKDGMKNAGVFSSSLNKNTIDESKGAYKSSEMIQEAIQPTATIIEKVKPILNIKDSSSEMSFKEKRRQRKDQEERRNKELNDLAYKKMKKIK